MNSKISFLSVLFLLQLFYSCNKNNELISFDISPNNDKILFSVKKPNNQTSIYISDIEGKNISELFDSDSLSFFAPRYSQTGDSIVYISSDYPKSLKTSIGILNLKSKKDSILFSSSNFIKEAIYDQSSNSLYYLRGNEFDNYSPIGIKALHGFDIYEYAVDNKKEIKLFDSNAYSMGNLLLNKENLIFNATFGSLDSLNGLYSLEKQNKQIKRISVTNDPVSNSESFSNANVVNENIFICKNIYEIIIIDLNKKLQSKISRSITGRQIALIRFSKKNNEIYFSETKSNKIYVIDLNGNLKKTIDINIPNN